MESALSTDAVNAGCQNETTQDFLASLSPDFFTNFLDQSIEDTANAPTVPDTFLHAGWPENHFTPLPQIEPPKTPTSLMLSSSSEASKLSLSRMLTPPISYAETSNAHPSPTVQFCGNGFPSDSQFDHTSFMHAIKDHIDPGPSRRKPRITAGYSCMTKGCNKTFDHASKLRKHEQRVHLPEIARPLGCDWCEKRFCDQRDLQRHLSSHQPKTQLQSSSAEKGSKRRKRLGDGPSNPRTQWYSKDARDLLDSPEIEMALNSPHHDQGQTLRDQIMNEPTTSPKILAHSCTSCPPISSQRPSALDSGRSPPVTPVIRTQELIGGAKQHNSIESTSIDCCLETQRSLAVSQLDWMELRYSEIVHKQAESHTLSKSKAVEEMDTAAVTSSIIALAPRRLALNLSSDFDSDSQFAFLSLLVPYRRKALKREFEQLSGRRTTLTVAKLVVLNYDPRLYRVLDVYDLAHLGLLWRLICKGLGVPLDMVTLPDAQISSNVRLGLNISIAMPGTTYREELERRSRNLEKQLQGFQNAVHQTHTAMTGPRAASDSDRLRQRPPLRDPRGSWGVCCHYLPLIRSTTESQVLQPEALVVLFTPVLEPGIRGQSGSTEVQCDPFQSLGQAISEHHKRVRHVPYITSVCLTETHTAFYRHAAVVVVVVCDPKPRSRRASLWDQNDMVRDGRSVGWLLHHSYSLLVAQKIRRIGFASGAFQVSLIIP